MVSSRIPHSVLACLCKAMAMINSITFVCKGWKKCPLWSIPIVSWNRITPVHYPTLGPTPSEFLAARDTLTAAATKTNKCAKSKRKKTISILSDSETCSDVEGALGIEDWLQQIATSDKVLRPVTMATFVSEDVLDCDPNLQVSMKVDVVDQNDGVAKTCLKKVAKNSRNPPPSLSQVRTRKQGPILDSDVPMIDRYL